jgi:type I restriction enzyme S subunit
MEMTTLGNLVSLQRGYDLTETQRRPGSVPVVGSAGIHGYHDTSKAKGPGVTLGRSGASFGKVTFIREDFWPHNTTIFVTDFKGNEPLFIRYLLESLDFSSLNSGSAQQSLNRNFVYPVRVRKFALPAQRSIVDMLSAYDELIENNQRRIRILEEMGRALYHEWFVNFRFPGREKVKLVSSALGQIPQGWSVEKLSDVAEVNSAQINARNAPDELHYIDISSVSPGQIDSITTYAFADAPGRARRIVAHGDVLWSCVRPNRRSHALVMYPEENTIASTGFAVLTAKTVPFTFLYAATTTDDFVGYLTSNASGAAYPAVTAETFHKAELLVAPPALLKHFGDATLSMAEQGHILQRQTTNLRRTRNLLLPRLLSGKRSRSIEN